MKPHFFYMSLPVQILTLSILCLSAVSLVPVYTSINFYTPKKNNSQSISQVCNRVEVQRHIEDLPELDLAPVEELIACGSVAVPELINLLNQDNWQIQVVAAYILGEIGATSDDAVSNLVEATRDENENVRFSAVRSLGKIGSIDSVPALTQALQDRDRTVRLGAINSLIQLAPERIFPVPALFEVLQSEYLSPNWHALLLLQEEDEYFNRQGIDSISYMLVAALGASEWSIRHNATKALAQLIDQDQTVLLNLLSEYWSWSDSGLLKGQIESLVDQVGPDILLELLESPLPPSFQNQRWAIESSAIEILGDLRVEAAVPKLIALIQSKSEHEFLATKALGNIGSGAAVPVLIDQFYSLREFSFDERTVATALAQIGTQEAVATLINALDSENPALRTAALQALGNVASEKSTQLLNETRYQSLPTLIEVAKNGIQVLNYYESETNSRLMAVSALGFIGPSVLPSLTENLPVEDGVALFVEVDSENPTIEELLLVYYDSCVRPKFDSGRDDLRILTQSYLEYTGPIVVPSLIDLTTTLANDAASETTVGYSEENYDLIALIEALGSLKAHEAVPELLQILELHIDNYDDNYFVILSTLDALKSIKSVEAVAPLAELLNSASAPRVRASIANTLGRIGSKEAIPPLVEALQSQQSQLQPEVPEAEYDYDFAKKRAELSMALAIARLDSESALPTIIALLEEEDAPEYSYHTQEIIWHLRYVPDSAIPYLIARLQDKDWLVGYIAADSLAYIGAPSVPALIEQLHMPADLSPALRQALRDKEVHTRRSAAYTLSKIGAAAQDAVEPLMAVVGDDLESQSVREMAALALLEIGQNQPELDISKLSIEADNQLLADQSLYIGSRIYYNELACGDSPYYIFQRIRDLLENRR